MVAIVGAIVFPALGVAATWGALGSRLRQVEKDSDKLDALKTKLGEVDVRTLQSAIDQGRRLEIIKDDVLLIKGFQAGGAAEARRRAKTGAHGVKDPT